MSPFVLIALFQTKHFLCDFVLQTPYQLNNKGNYGHPGGLLHSGLHSAFTAALVATAFSVLTALAVAALEFLVHYHVDWAKQKIESRMHISIGSGKFFAILGFDQLLHQLTYVAFAAYLFA